MNKSLQLLSVATVLTVGFTHLAAQSNTSVVTTPEPVQSAVVPSTPVSATPATAVAVPDSEVPVKAKKEPLKAQDQKGKISAIDTTAGTFTVEGRNFVSAKRCKVFIDGVPMSLSDLKDGDMVAVSYFDKADGTNSAFRIFKGSGRKTKKSASKQENTDQSH